MKKKQQASDLISGILGGGIQEAKDEAAPANQPQQIRTDLPETTIEELGISPDLVEALNAERRKNVGRPKKDLRSAKEYGCMAGDTRATFILKKDLVTKLKYISLMETRTLKSLLADVLGGFVAEWERDNGTINLKNSQL